MKLFPRERSRRDFAPCIDGTLREHAFSSSSVQMRFARRWLSTILCVCGIRQPAIQDALIASGEALANSVEHAYHGDRRGEVQIRCYCCTTHGTILIEVGDNGSMQHHDEPTQNRGFGFTLMRAIAQDVNVLSGGGTVVTLLLDIA
ncbi:MAG: ATP-binding protein [Vulcanimicrobiaceae bacterium]